MAIVLLHIMVFIPMIMLALVAIHWARENALF